MEKVVVVSYEQEMEDKITKLYKKIVEEPTKREYDNMIINSGKGILESLRIVQKKLEEINVMRDSDPDLFKLEKKLKFKAKKLMMMGKLIEISIEV